MENKAQKKVLIIVGVILLLIVILAYILSSLITDSEEPNTPSDPDPNVPNEVFRDEIQRLEDDSVFFEVQKIINDYYNRIFEEDTSTLLSILDPNYIEENQIRANNLYSIIGRDYGITNYVAKEIY